jgi:hypothetical protein
VGAVVANDEDLGTLSFLDPPEVYDSLLRANFYAAQRSVVPLDTPWTRRALSDDSYRVVRAARKKYKPVDRKVRPVPSYMPDPAGQVFKPVVIPELEPLPLDPPFLADFEPTPRLTRDRLDFILKTVPEGFLLKREVDLFVYMLKICDKALAFVDAERGSFSRDYFPDYEIPVIEHTPWVQPPIRVPKAIESTVRQMLEDQKAAGKYEYSTASYRSRIFTVAKKETIKLRIVHDVQELNKVTIRDAALPPRVDDFAEGLVGRSIYALVDLFAGYDGRVLSVKSRPLTTFTSIIGPHRLTSLPQGATNSMPEFQRCTRHVLHEELNTNSDVFIDDVTFMGGTSTYNDELIAPGIRRFVYEFASTFRRCLVRLITAGVTASGWKIVLATPRLKVVGTVVSGEGWHLEHGLVTKILNWPAPQNLTDVRAFLGTAGVGRKWIKNFSVIAKPLTFLTRLTEKEFYFDDSAQEAMNKLKELVSTAPVLVRLDYNLAKLITPPPRDSDNGLVTVAVDSCSNGTGWVVYQLTDGDRHPILFGSCTFNDTESRYSQPKCELYGVFRALKDLRHRVWGIHFRLEVDAKFLVEMIKSPDLPNAPMTRWVMYLSLFDFEINHVPADKHHASDGLSRRRRAPEDSEDEDADEYLEKFMGFITLVRGPSREILLTFSPRDQNHPSPAFSFTMPFRPMPEVPFGDYSSPTTLSTLAVPWINQNDEVQGRAAFVTQHLAKLGQNPFSWDPKNADGTLLTRSLLSTIDPFYYTGHEFENRKVASFGVVKVLLGEEWFEMEVVTYGYEFMSGPKPGAPTLSLFDENPAESTRFGYLMRTDTRKDYEEVSPDGYIACISHAFGTKDLDSSKMWDEIKTYLKDGLVPSWCVSLKEKQKFLGRARSFALHDDRIWKVETKGRSPRLVITDVLKRRSLIADAHNQVGHRGRDGTFKLISDRYYWPNLYDDVAYFVRSCYACQLQSKMRPKIPFSPTWNTAILRRFDFDTIHMGKGHGGMKYLLQAIEPAIGWPEGRAARRNTSEVWAKFIYEDIICRFGCIPYCVVDGGSEFQGAARILFEKYSITIIVSSPYHPQGNAVAERSHQTLCDAIFRACGARRDQWPLFVHAGLLAMRCSTSRMTGYEPYYLLYGRHPLLAFDITDRTWEALDWHKVVSTEDLIAIRIQQITRRDVIAVEALERQKEKRQRAVDDFNKKYGKSFTDGRFPLGTWVLKHETWLDTQMGNKGALRWTGPFVVHEELGEHNYRLRELDGTVRREKVSKHRLKIFYFRQENQSIRSVGSSGYTPAIGDSFCPHPDDQHPSFPVSYISLGGIGPNDSVEWMMPYNSSLRWYPIVSIGNRAIYSTTRIGDLDNVWESDGDEECTLLDPACEYTLFDLDTARRRHNIHDLMRLRQEFLSSSLAMLC